MRLPSSVMRPGPDGDDFALLRLLLGGVGHARITVVTKRRDEIRGLNGGVGRADTRATHAGGVEAQVGDRCRCLRVAPVLEVAARGDVGRRARPVGAERDPVRDRRAGADGPRGPGAPARLDDPAAARDRRSGTRRSTARRDPARRCRPARAPRAASVSCVERLVGGARPLEAEPHEVHAEQRGRRDSASSMVQTFSLPIATPCSLTPCSKPQSQSGRDRATRARPCRAASGTACAACPPRGASVRSPRRSATSSGGRSEFFANSVPSASDDAQRVAHRRVSPVVRARRRGDGR